MRVATRKVKKMLSRMRAPHSSKSLLMLPALTPPAVINAVATAAALLLVATIVAIAVISGLFSAATPSTSPVSRTTRPVTARDSVEPTLNVDRMPFQFERVPQQNPLGAGGADAAVRFVAHAPGGTFF